MTGRTLKSAFAVSVVLCIGMASTLGYILWQHSDFAVMKTDAGTVVARGPEAQPETVNTRGPASSAKTDEPVLSPIQLSPQRMQEIGVTTTVAEMKDMNDELQAPGSVAIDEQRLSYVQTRFPGWIKSVFANATYQYVKKGQKLFTIYSPDLVSTEQEYLLAKKNQVAVSEHMHGTPAEEGNWLLQAAAERLRRYDIPEAEIEQLEKGGTASHEIGVESPASGYIIERNAMPNAYVQPETKLYTIADLSTVWIYANVPQADVGRLKPGDLGRVSVDAYPGRQFNGRIDQILPDVDATTRTVRVRLVMSNPGILLKPGMYVNVDIAAPLGRQLVIPASGMLQSGTRQIAFLDKGQGSLEPREIETGARLGDSVVVLKGLKAGDRIVSSASFLLDSEAQLQSSMSGYLPQQQNASPQQSTEQMHIDFSTDPNPPHKGSNKLHLKLTGADGKPIVSVQPSVTFFMPAMPAMGMAAEHAVAMLTDKGNGDYQGTVQLDSGGTWQVTVTVLRGTNTVAAKQLSISATGGM
ncbi:efflux RND transporter periplasmic adaptor subunit [Telmatobacter sp. DSM 110680]|uniref:Efflux RND transporter periplasmic adaptor subunit n=1 Tax=Telmatobacter sp. DSM 110680 TaxID=3036704 RepID=A0AAU7DIB2_9BACT